MRPSAASKTSRIQGRHFHAKCSDGKPIFMLAVFAVLSLAGCKTPEQMLDATQPKAMKVAETRARIEMNCPVAAGTVLSRVQVTPPGGVAVRGMNSSEYKVGITGCGNHETMLVVCPSDGGCYVAQIL
jgi:hypothetical protein